MTCAYAGRFGGDADFVSDCGTAAVCMLPNIGGNKRISERIPFVIVGCIGFPLAGPARVAAEECPLLVGWTDYAMRAFIARVEAAQKLRTQSGYSRHKVSRLVQI